MNVNTIWENIRAHEGEIFRTETGLEFTYQVGENKLRIFRNGAQINRVISIVDFEKALNYRGASRKEFGNLVNGSSYVKGILSDERIYAVSVFFGFDPCGKSFTHAGKIKPCVDENKNIITYSAYDKKSTYSNDPNYQLMDLPKVHPLITTVPHEIVGNREFCTIDMSQLSLPNSPGVYLWVIDNTVVYIGRAMPTAPLYKRFANGYSQISCRRCWKRVSPAIQRG